MAVIANREVGRVRVLSLHPVGSVLPRIELRIGLTLRELSPDHIGGLPLSSYSVRSLAGELRLSEHADVVSGLRWLNPSARLQSSATGYEQHAHFGINLDSRILEKIEGWRRGSPPTFWLQLWPIVTHPSEGWYECSIPSFSFSVPRETWLTTLEGLGIGRFLVLEVPLTLDSSDIYPVAARHLHDAIGRLDTGQHGEAIGHCRLAVEAMFTILTKTRDQSLAAFLSQHTHPLHAAQYSEILRAIKEITNLPHHTSSSPRVFVRSEAVFVVQTTQHLLSLIGDLASNPHS